MRKFLCRFMIFMSLALAGAIISIVFYAPQYAHGYNASALDKIARLESLPSPKIILVGNSSLSFGIKSPMIEEALGMPVVNLGLHGGLGNRFHEEMAKYNIGKGDILVVCHTEYSDNNKINDHVLAWITIENHYHLWRLVRYDILGMIEYFPKYVARLIFSSKDDKNGSNAYTRSAFNKYGDDAFLRPKSARVFQAGELGVPPINDTCTRRLNEFNRYCAKRGAKLVIAGYPVADGEFTPDRHLFKEAWNALQEKLDFPVISNIEDYFFPYSVFYNTTLHLTDEGATMRTQQLIDDLMRSGL